jgi:hypothetical protein
MNSMVYSPTLEGKSTSAGQQIPPHLTEPEGSSLCSEEPVTGSYQEPDVSNPHPYTLLLMANTELFLI